LHSAHGYTPPANNFDALISGYYAGNRLIYVGRTRNGFTPAIQAQLFKRFRALESELWEKRLSTFFANHLRREIWATPSAVARETSGDWFFSRPGLAGKQL
jgi:ATP-dependent DNA ligase